MTEIYALEAELARLQSWRLFFLALIVVGLILRVVARLMAFRGRSASENSKYMARVNKILNERKAG